MWLIGPDVTQIMSHMILKKKWITKPSNLSLNFAAGTLLDRRSREGKRRRRRSRSRSRSVIPGEIEVKDPEAIRCRCL